MADILIVGGGVIGMLLAKELVQRSLSVKLIERNKTGQEASWAGGGIVSPLYPWAYSPPVTALASWAQAAYPELSEELLNATGIDPEFNPCGLLMLDPPEQSRILQWAQDNDRAAEVLSKTDSLGREPELASCFAEAVYWPEIGNIRNPRLLQSLAAYLQQHPLCTLETDCEAIAVDRNGQGNAVVQTTLGERRAEKVVVCAGAWAGQLLRESGVQLQVQPVKGQMLVFRPGGVALNSIVLSNGRYLIPRRDGRIVVGSTLEHTGFSKSTSQEARAELESFAWNLVPALKSGQVEAHWAGLRPGSPHGIPYIGAVPDYNNLYVNAGHFRNGLVLAPASVRLMRNILLGETPIVDPVPYHITSPRPSAEMF